MPAEWVDVSAAVPWPESSPGGEDHPISRLVQERLGSSRNYGRQAGRSLRKAPDLWGQGDWGESEEQEGGAREWVQLVQSYNFYWQSAKGQS
jgi:hypothetical protein